MAIEIEYRGIFSAQLDKIPAELTATDIMIKSFSEYEDGTLEYSPVYTATVENTELQS